MTTETADHRHWMARCLNLAAQGFGHVSPNPMVGAVVVYENQVLAEGYHANHGGAHAEVQALSRVSEPEKLAHSTLYVNLEPCTHHGKTPPCVDRIIEFGVPKVVIGSHDPNPEVAGNGVEKLRSAGVTVITEVLKARDHELNRRFHTFHKQHIPYIILKWAQSADGYLADEQGRSGWISNVYARTLVHQWRAQESAIMVGSQTALMDNPKLNPRLWQGAAPLRILLDPEKELTPNAQLLKDGLPTWVLNKHENKHQGNVTFFKVAAETVEWLPFLLNKMVQGGYQSLIVEGGGMLLDTFIRHGQWHEARIFTGTRPLGGGVPAPQVRGRLPVQNFIGNDLLQVRMHT